MRSMGMVLMMALVVSPLIPLVFADATSCVGCPEGVIRKSITSIKFLDAYFGTSSGKIEVGPGDKNVPFTISMTNVGTQDLTGIQGQLLLPAQFSSQEGYSGLILADNDAKAVAGNSFYLTFFVNVNEDAQIQSYSGTVKVDYSRLRESGERQDFFDFSFKLTGDRILNLTPLTPYITSITNNDVSIEVSNGGSAPLSNVDIILKNDQTSSTTTSKSKNLENVIFDETHWDVGTISAKSTESFNFKIFVPDSIKNELLHLPLAITYFDAYGKSQTVTRVAAFYINGLVDPYVYGVKVIDLSGKQTVIGDILNQGNSDGLFGFVTLKPRGDSNIQESTQYIDDIEPDSPVPFNIPIGAASNGDHEITIEVTYKDSLRNDQLITYDTTINVNAPLIANSGDGAAIGPIIAIIVILGIVFYLYKKGKLPMISKKV